MNNKFFIVLILIISLPSLCNDSDISLKYNPLTEEDVQEIVKIRNEYHQLIPAQLSDYLKKYNKLLDIKFYEKFGAPMGRTKTQLLFKLMDFIIKTAYKEAIDVIKPPLVGEFPFKESKEILYKISANKIVNSKLDSKDEELLRQLKMAALNNFESSAGPKGYAQNIVNRKYKLQSELVALSLDYLKLRNAIKKLHSMESRNLIKILPESIQKLFPDIFVTKIRNS